MLSDRVKKMGEGSLAGSGGEGVPRESEENAKPLWLNVLKEET